MARTLAWAETAVMGATMAMSVMRGLRLTWILRASVGCITRMLILHYSQ
jgi:hypothetical protein